MSESPAGKSVEAVVKVVRAKQAIKQVRGGCLVFLFLLPQTTHHPVFPFQTLETILYNFNILGGILKVKNYREPGDT